MHGILCVCVCVSMSVCMCVCVCVGLYAFAHACMCVYVCAYVIVRVGDAVYAPHNVLFLKNFLTVCYKESFYLLRSPL